MCIYIYICIYIYTYNHPKSIDSYFSEGWLNLNQQPATEVPGTCSGGGEPNRRFLEMGRSADKKATMAHNKGS